MKITACEPPPSSTGPRPKTNAICPHSPPLVVCPSLEDWRISTFVLPFIWGWAILASWIGWGRLLSLAIPDVAPGSLDAGLLAGWGACIILFFGGILNAAAACSIPTVASLVAIGIAVAMYDLFRRRPKFPPIAGYFPLAFLVLIIYSAAVCWRATWNASDDLIAYLIYPIKMLQSGAALDPFSLRRLSTLGGYSFLQSTLSLVAMPQNAFLLDIGLGGILACLLTIPLLRRTGASRLFASLVGVICLTIPLGRINSMSYALSLAAFLILFRTISLLAESTGAARLPLCWIAGLVAAGITSLRPNFLPVVGLTLLLSEMFWPIPRPQAIRELAHILAASLCTILPWCLALHAATGSWFYPIFKGNQRYGIDFLSAHMPLLTVFRFILGFFIRPKMLLLILAGAIGVAGARPHVKALWLASVISAGIVTSQFTSSDFSNLTRYSLPPLAAATIAIWIDMQSSSSRARRFLGQCLTITFAGLLTVFSCLSHSGAISQSLTSIDIALIHGTPLYANELPQLYADAQSSIPPGRRILTAVDYPFLLNYARNPVESLDEPGFASPRPGLPFFRGSAAVAQYLRDQSIDALIVENFDDAISMYRRDTYKSATSPDNQIGRPAPYELDLMQNIDDLASENPLLFNRGGLRVIRLRGEPPR